MRYLTFDVESHLIKKGLTAPKLVCLSYVFENKIGLLHRDDALVFMRQKIAEQDIVFIGHNIQFDFGVLVAEDPNLLPLVFELYEKHRVRDTLIRQKLMDIAEGNLRFYYDEELEKLVKNEYKLSDLTRRLLHKELKKVDTWRLKYALLDNVPIEEWPEDAKQYAIDDAVSTFEVFNKQIELCGDITEIPNSGEQHMAAWALHLMSTWGIRTDGPAVERLRKALTEEREKALQHLRTTDILHHGDKKNLAAIRQRIYDGYTRRELGDIPVTEKKHQIQTSAKVMLLSGDPDLKVLADALKGMKLLETFVPVLERGTKIPINASYNVLVDTGRTSCVAKGTMVPIIRGATVKRICVEDIQRGDFVWAFDDERNLVFKPVVWAGKTGVKRLLRVSYRMVDGYTTGYVDLTADHRVRKADGDYVRADELSLKDQMMGLLCLPGQLPKPYIYAVNGVEELPYTAEVYDMTVEGVHNFIANEICVHNCFNPNLQNLSRRGGVRECFVARPGTVFCNIDYDTIELRSLAQVCLDLLGFSNMAEALRRGEDLHLNLAADLLKISKEEATKLLKSGDKLVEDRRQLAKIMNFGAPGGMSAETFVEYALGYGVTVELKLAQETHAQWKKSWSEMKAYFAMVSSLTRGDLVNGKVLQVRSGRVRGGVTFTAAANGFFQGLAADGAKEALWAVAKECYAIPSSPIFGCRPVLFIHDEIGSEFPYDPKNPKRTSDMAKHKQKLMVDAMKKWIPDIPITATPVLMKRWYKGAKPVYDQQGNLVPCKPQLSQDGKKTLWVADV